MTESKDANILTRAAVLMGGVLRFAQFLGVTAEDVLAWISSKASAPEEALTKAKAIIETFEIDRTGTRVLKLDALKAPKERPD